MAQFYSAKRRVTTRQIITVTVNDLDPFGQGVARHQGKALFISGLLPQEQADVVVVEDKKQYARAQVKRRLSDSPQRQAPRCPHFGICGGCLYQPIPYEEQLAIKEKQVRSLLDAVCPEYEFEGILGSPLVQGYRNKMEFSFGDEVKDENVKKVLYFLNQIDAEALNQISEVNIANPEAVVAYANSPVQIRLGKLDRRGAAPAD
mgnify:CR=1 FL=1